MHIYKFTSKCHSSYTTLSSKRIYPEPENRKNFYPPMQIIKPATMIQSAVTTTTISRY